MERNRVTDEEKRMLYLALENKCNAPDITFDDIYHGIDEIHASFPLRKLYWHTPGVLLVVVSIIMIICCEAHSNWYVTGLMIYLIGGVLESIVVYKQYGGKGLTIAIVILIVMGYVAKNRDLDFNWLIKFIKEVQDFF